MREENPNLKIELENPTRNANSVNSQLREAGSHTNWRHMFTEGSLNMKVLRLLFF